LCAVAALMEQVVFSHEVWGVIGRSQYGLATAVGDQQFPSVLEGLVINTRQRFAGQEAWVSCSLQASDSPLHYKPAAIDFGNRGTQAHTMFEE